MSRPAGRCQKEPRGGGPSRIISRRPAACKTGLDLLGAPPGVRVDPRPMKTVAATYAERDEILKRLGWPNYDAYLASALWASVRSKVMTRDKSTCRCGSKASQVHHSKYTEANLKGVSLADMLAICDACHNSLEFRADGTKRSHLEVQQFEASFWSGGPRGKPRLTKKHLRRAAMRGLVVEPPRCIARIKGFNEATRAAWNRGVVINWRNDAGEWSAVFEVAMGQPNSRKHREWSAVWRCGSGELVTTGHQELRCTSLVGAVEIVLARCPLPKRGENRKRESRGEKRKAKAKAKHSPPRPLGISISDAEARAPVVARETRGALTIELVRTTDGGIEPRKYRTLAQIAGR